MALFKRKAEDGAPQSLTPAEAVAGIAMCATYADGHISAEEDQDLEMHLAKMKLYRGKSEREIRAMFQKVHGISSKEGDARVLELACAALPENLKPTAFLVAVDVILGDHDFGTEERKFVEDLKRQLGLTEDVARKILDVVEIKQRG